MKTEPRLNVPLRRGNLAPVAITELNPQSVCSL